MGLRGKDAGIKATRRECRRSSVLIHGGTEARRHGERQPRMSGEDGDDLDAIKSCQKTEGSKWFWIREHALGTVHEFILVL